MGVTNPYKTYENNKVTTASPGELTLMLYNGFLKFIQRAKQEIIEKKYQEKNESIQKSQKIIHELMVTLKPEYEISKELMNLYEYINRRLIEANIKNDSNILDEMTSIITEIRDTWKQVIQINRQQQSRGRIIDHA